MNSSEYFRADSTVSKSCPGFSLDLGLTKEPGISWLHFWVEHFELHWEKHDFGIDCGFSPFFLSPAMVNHRNVDCSLLSSFFRCLFIIMHPTFHTETFIFALFRSQIPFNLRGFLMVKENFPEATPHPSR